MRVNNKIKINISFLLIIISLISCNDHIEDWERDQKIKTYFQLINREEVQCIEGMPCQINWCGPNADTSRDCKNLSNIQLKGE